MSRHRVFVYGSLMRGERNHYRLARAEFMGEVSTAGAAYALHSVADAFPALTDGEQQVRGEVYVVDDSMLLDLDTLERHPVMYERRIIPLSDGTEAWAYFAKDSWLTAGPVVQSGSWRHHPRRRF